MTRLSPPGHIFVKFGIGIFFENLWKIFRFLSGRTRRTGTLHEDHYTFIITSRSVPPRIRNVLDKWCRENQNPLFVFSNCFSENLAVYENMEHYGRDRQATEDSIIRRKRITKATNTHSEYVVLIPFPLQQWLQELASMLCYTYIACLVVCGCR
jgi:hypothetical protein